MKTSHPPFSHASSGPQLLDVLRVDWLFIAATMMVAGAVVTLAISGCVFTQRRRRSHRYRTRNQGVLCTRVQWLRMSLLGLFVWRATLVIELAWAREDI